MLWPENWSPPALVSNRLNHRPDCQQRADYRFDIGSLDETFGEQRRARDSQDWRSSARIADFRMVFSFSDFIVGGEKCARPYGRQALRANGKSRGPARVRQARLGDAGHGDGSGLVATRHEEMRVVLTQGKADMAAGTTLKNQHRAGIERPRVYRRVICSTTRRPSRACSGLQRTPPLLLRG